MSEEYLQDSVEVEELMYENNVVKLKNPGMDYFADFLKVSGEIAKLNQRGIEGGELFGSLSNESLMALQKIVIGSLEKSFPDKWKDANKREDLKQWGLQNGMTIMMKVLEMCSPQGVKNDKARIDKIREKINAQRDTGNQ